MKREVVRTRNFANDATNFIVEKARAALTQRDEFRIALSGGNTPRGVYLELAKRKLPWEKALITFGDERCVPPEDAESNFKMASETLLKPAAIPASSVLRMRGEVAPVTNCVMTGTATCEVGGDTSDWLQHGEPSTNWRNGSDGTSGSASG